MNPNLALHEVTFKEKIINRNDDKNNTPIKYNQNKWSRPQKHFQGAIEPSQSKAPLSVPFGYRKEGNNRKEISKITRTRLKQHQWQQQRRRMAKMNNQSNLVKSRTRTQEKVIQSFSNTVSNIQTKQHTFRLEGRLRIEKYHHQFLYFYFFIFFELKLWVS